MVLPVSGASMRETCRDLDILFVADEVITGFGRTGPLFACEMEEVVPDMMTVAKGLTSGYVPMGALFMREEIYQTIAESAGAAAVGHGFTYSAHPVSAAAGLATLKLYTQGGLLANGQKMGERFNAGLERLRDHPLVGDVRGRGLLAAVELVSDKAAKTKFDPDLKLSERLFEAAYRNGLILRAFTDDVLGFAPPLSCTEDEIDLIVERVRSTLDTVLDLKEVRAVISEPA
jgi:adenosylmethionine-8-amino-7-oxononanoate aminotransferase